MLGQEGGQDAPLPCFAIVSTVSHIRTETPSEKADSYKNESHEVHETAGGMQDCLTTDGTDGHG